MIKQNAIAELRDVNERPLIMEINFNDKYYKDCVRMTFTKTPDDIEVEEFIFKYSELFSFMFTLASPEQQALMMPVSQELGHEYMKQIRIKCKKDMKKGEELVVNVKVHVPTVVEEQIIKDLKTPFIDNNVKSEV